MEWREERRVHLILILLGEKRERDLVIRKLNCFLVIPFLSCPTPFFYLSTKTVCAALYTGAVEMVFECDFSYGNVSAFIH